MITPITACIIAVVCMFIGIYMLLSIQAARRKKASMRECVKCGKKFSLGARNIDPKRVMLIHYNFCNKCIKQLTLTASSTVINYKEIDSYESKRRTKNQ